MKILIINGPNLNLLGKREPEIYGSIDFETYYDNLLYYIVPQMIELEYYQSNIEGEIINKIHSVGFKEEYDGIVLNAGGYTHTSVAIRDAIAGIIIPVIEVHISNVHTREEFRHHSMISAVCKGVICGFGLDSYRLAIEAILGLKEKDKNFASYKELLEHEEKYEDDFLRSVYDKKKQQKNK